ncbi:MAG: hypothetical protein MK085_10545, partial [Phycisphaerales bacterium]|nr:hypothetical protein [Phycisphaerales bacterium]
KRAYGNAEIRGRLDDPLHGPVDSSVELVLKNPIDRTIRVDVAPASRLDAWQVGQLPFVARTPRDTRNTSTTDFDTPFTLQPINDTFELAAGETLAIPLRFTSPATQTPPPPPQLLVTTTFLDDKAREVPVFLHRRIPIRRWTTRENATTHWPVSAWRHSVYDLPEADSTVRLDLRGPAPMLELRLVDNLLCEVDLDAETLAAKHTNPPEDLVRISVQVSGTRREFLLEPASGDGVLVEIEGRKPRARHEDAWTSQPAAEHEAARLQIRLPGVDSSKLEGIQVEIADNDRTYHTQWRRLAPSGDWLRITSGAP